MRNKHENNKTREKNVIEPINPLNTFNLRVLGTSVTVEIVLKKKLETEPELFFSNMNKRPYFFANDLRGTRAVSSSRTVLAFYPYLFYRGSKKNEAKLFTTLSFNMIIRKKKFF